MLVDLPDKPTMTTAEVAKYFSKSAQWVRKMARTNKFPFAPVRVGHEWFFPTAAIKSVLLGKPAATNAPEVTE